MSDLITTALVRLDASLGDAKHDVIRALAGLVGDAGRAERRRAARQRRLRPRGRPPRPACPAASRSRTAGPTGVEEPTLAFARLDPDGRLRRQGRPGRPGLPDRRSRRRRRRPPADPHQAGARPGEAGLHRRAAPRRSPTRPSSTWSAASSASAPRPPPHLRPPLPPARLPRRRPRRPPSPEAGGRRRIVAVTACPTGIAHTYMAAEALRGRRRAGRRRHPGRDPGLGRVDPAGPRHHRRRRRGDLRRRRGRPRPRPVRRQAGRRLRRQARRSTTPTR